jgi:hypothetical protein
MTNAMNKEVVIVTRIDQVIETFKNKKGKISSFLIGDIVKMSITMSPFISRLSEGPPFFNSHIQQQGFPGNLHMPFDVWTLKTEGRAN